MRIALTALWALLILPQAAFGEAPGQECSSMETINPISREELTATMTGAFDIAQTDKNITIMTDIPKPGEKSSEGWYRRIEMSRQWAHDLAQSFPDKKVDFLVYGSTGANNGELPTKVWSVNPDQPAPRSTGDIPGEPTVVLEEYLRSADVVLAPTEYSATAYLRSRGKPLDFRGATLPGFSYVMLPAMRIDFIEATRRCDIIKGHLDQATIAQISFSVRLGKDKKPLNLSLQLDLRNRKPVSAGGIIRERGFVGNLPGGETFIVPYEGEITGQKSQTKGLLPVQMGDEVVIYKIEGNKAVDVITDGPRSQIEREHIKADPAYGNIAELGMGVLSGMGVTGIPDHGDSRDNVLLNEKLGLHIAFGRSEHLGGTVGPGAFKSPQSVIHIDHVYVPEMQPLIQIKQLNFNLSNGRSRTIMKNGVYVPNLFD